MSKKDLVLNLFCTLSSRVLKPMILSRISLVLIFYHRKKVKSDDFTNKPIGRNIVNKIKTFFFILKSLIIFLLKNIELSILTFKTETTQYCFTFLKN